MAEPRALAEGVACAAGAGLLWGLVFVAPLMLPDYPGPVLSVGRYLAFGIVALGLAVPDRAALARLTPADWREAAKLAAVGNLAYYACLATALQWAGATLPTLMIGTLPLVIALCANLGAGGQALPWARLAPPLGLIAAGLGLAHSLPAGEGQAASASYVAGVALAAGAVACWTWYPIRNARWLQARPGLPSRAWATAQGLATLPLALLGVAVLAAWPPLAPGFPPPLGPRPLAFVGLMFAIGIGASWLGTLLWNRASRLLPTALSGQLIVFETLAALLYAFIWQERPPTAQELTGIALLVAGVIAGVRAFREGKN
mgnify:CR=1 FL=1